VATTDVNRDPHQRMLALLVKGRVEAIRPTSTRELRECPDNNDLSRASRRPIA
jgi:hypothetical protein